MNAENDKKKTMPSTPEQESETEAGLTGVEKAAEKAKSGNLRDLINWLLLRGVKFKGLKK